MSKFMWLTNSRKAKNPTKTKMTMGTHVDGTNMYENPTNEKMTKGTYGKRTNMFAPRTSKAASFST